jgi:hypothetical protein
METKKRTPTEAQAEREWYKLMEKLKKELQQKEQHKKEQQREEYLCK